MSKTPRLVADVVAGNSSEVLEACLDHHRALGVDAFVVVHVYSEDDTLARLEEAARRYGDLHLFLASPEQSLSGQAHRDTLEFARERLGADWIVKVDCDERWFVRDGDLRQVLAETKEPALVAPRYNIVWPNAAIGPEVNSARLCAASLPVAAFPVVIRPEEHERLSKIPWVLTKIAPRTCLRATKGIAFNLGGHLPINADGSPAVAARRPGVFVAQLAFTTFNRFERKVSAIGRMWPSVRTRFDPSTAWHWDRLARIYAAGPQAVRAEWERQFMTPEQARIVAGREVIVDGRDCFGL